MKNIIYKYHSCVSASNDKKWFFFQVWEDTVGCRRQALAPRACIHLISSSPSSILLIVDLARHRAGWPWAECLSRSSVYRLSSHELKENVCVLRVSIRILIAGILQYNNRSGLLLVRQRKYLRVLLLLYPPRMTKILHTIGLLQQQWTTFYFSPLLVCSDPRRMGRYNNNPAVENTCQLSNM